MRAMAAWVRALAFAGVVAALCTDANAQESGTESAPPRPEAVEASPSGGGSIPLQASPPTSNPDQLTWAKLVRPMPAEFLNVPLVDALDYVRDYADLQIYVDTKELENSGLTLDAVIDLNLQQASGEMVLDIVLKRAGLSYYLNSGVVVITTPSAMSAVRQTRVYSVHDLIAPPEATRTLSDLIQQSLGKGTWEDQGGPGAIRGFRDTLVVTQNPQVQRQIEDLLQQLREATSAPK